MDQLPARSIVLGGYDGKALVRQTTERRDEDGQLRIDSTIRCRHVGDEHEPALEDQAGVEVERVVARSMVAMGEPSVGGEHFDLVGQIRHNPKVPLHIELQPGSKIERRRRRQIESFCR